MSMLDASVFDTKGWCHGASGLDDTVVAGVATAAVELWRTHVDNASTHTPQLLQWTSLWQRAPAFSSTTLWSWVAQVACRLLGCEQAQLLQDVLLVKEAGCAAPLVAHRDHAYVDVLPSTSWLTVRLALTPSTPEMGSMQVTPGSHRWASSRATMTSRTLHDAMGPSAELELCDAERAAYASTTTAMHLQVGDATVHHPLVLHGSGPNQTTTTRMTYVARVADASAVVDLSAHPVAMRPSLRKAFPSTLSGHLHPRMFPLLPSSTH